MNAEKYPGMGFNGQKTNFGFIAQELKDVFPEIVNTNKSLISNEVEDANHSDESDHDHDHSHNSKEVKGYYLVDYQSMIPVLTKAIQEQQSIIDGIKTENELLKKELEAIKSMVDELNRD